MLFQLEPPKPTIALTLNSAWNLYNFRLGLIRALLEAGYRVVAIAPSGKGEEEVRATGCTFIPLPHLTRKGTSPIQDLRLIRELRGIYRREGVDLVLHYTIKPVIYGSMATLGLRTKCINTITGLGFAFMQPGLVNKIVRTLYRTALRRADLTWFQNQDDLDFFLRDDLVPAKSAGLIHGSGIDTDHFSPLETSEGNSGIFLFIGRLLYDKGIREFFGAAKALGDRYKGVEFHVLGAIDYDNPSAIRANELDEVVASGNIVYHGEVKDTRPYIAKATAVVLPSYREGLPRVMLEGMAMAKPLIATDVPGCRETIVDGQNGYLVAVKHSESLAKGMEKILSLTKEERQKMGRLGRKLAEEKFAQEKIVAKYLSAIENLLAQD